MMPARTCRAGALALLAVLSLSGCLDSHGGASDGGTGLGDASDVGPSDAPVGDAGRDAVVDAPTDAPADARSGESYVFVVSSLEYGKPDPADFNIVPGFDQDGVDNRPAAAGGAGKTPSSCNQDDYTSPAPDNLPGVDNQLGVVLGLLGGPIDASPNEAVLDGELLWLLEVTGVDSLSEDADVGLELHRGVLRPGVDRPEADFNGLSGGQTFDVDGAGSRSIVNARIQGGRLIAPLRMDVAIPLQTASVSLELAPELRADISAARLTNGVVGARADADTLIEALNSLFDGTIDPGLIRTAIGGQADLDEAGGSCRTISAAFIFNGVPAQIGASR